MTDLGSDGYGAAAPVGSTMQEAETAEVRGPAAELLANRILLAGCLAGIAASIASLFFYTNGIFIERLTRELGWSRGEVGASAAVLTFGMALAAPFWGRLADRVPVRPLIVLSMCGVSLCFILLAVMPASLPAFLGIVLLMSLVGTGSSPVTFTAILNRHFDKARGTALGIALMGTGVGGALGAPLVATVIASNGWRAAYLALASVVAATALAVWFALRQEVKGAAAGPAKAADGLTFREATARPAFWLLGSIFLFASLGFGGFIVHFVGMLVEAGANPTEAALISSLIGVSVLVSRLTCGILIDRIFAPWVGAGAFAASAIGCSLITFAPEHAALGAILLGVAMGAEVDLVSYLVARYFGMRRYGAIYGAQYAAFLVGAGLSPMVMGMAADHHGGFRPIQIAATACLVFAAAAMLLLPRFPARGRQSSVQPEPDELVGVQA